MTEQNGHKTLNLYPIDYPFETLYNRITAEKPKLLLDPDFQRKFKWDKDGWERSSKFIESCLMRIPLPSCYFAEDEEGRHIVIDGVQRLTTIVRFFDDKFALEGLTMFKELEGKKYSELGEYQTELEATTIRCIVLRRENPKHLIREIFSRLNQGAVRLSDQEIRHALYNGSFNDLLTELAKNPVIKNFGLGETGVAPKDNLEAEEQVLRYFALKGDLENYQDKLAKYLDSFMSQNQYCSNENISSYRTDFESTLEKCVLIFGEDVFKDTSKRKKRQSMVYYDLLMYSLGQVDLETLRNKKVEVKEKFSELCKLSGFQRTLSAGLQNKASILKRRKLWSDLLSEALNG
ncbi:DUF262 domain-containing protein [Methylomonas sp. 2BW1-5-20]|uniref:DUF262 domain-containing protein n=1 Tax=Methylomonas sp. 2BW1-5-20 TaxID=3376686 RepID=UPI00404FE6BE